MIDILTNPSVIGAICTVVGILIQRYAPASIPFLGVGKLVIQELLKLHDDSSEENKEILNRALDGKLNLAIKLIAPLVENENDVDSNTK